MNEHDHNDDNNNDHAPRQSANAKTSAKTLLLTAGGLAVLVILAGFVLTGKMSGIFGASTPSGPAAVVNGEEIPRSEYEDRVDQFEASLSQQGQDVSSDDIRTQIREQALSNLIDETLLLQAAEVQGVTASEEEVEQAVAQVRGQFESEDAFNEQLAASGSTFEEYRTNVHRQLSIRQLIEANAQAGELEVSDEEVQTFYDQAVQGTEDAPALEQVRPQIETQLSQQKFQQVAQRLIEELRADADIERFVETS